MLHKTLVGPGSTKHKAQSTIYTSPGIIRHEAGEHIIISPFLNSDTSTHGLIACFKDLIAYQQSSAAKAMGGYGQWDRESLLEK